MGLLINYSFKRAEAQEVKEEKKKYKLINLNKSYKFEEDTVEIGSLKLNRRELMELNIHQMSNYELSQFTTSTGKDITINRTAKGFIINQTKIAKNDFDILVQIMVENLDVNTAVKVFGIKPLDNLVIDNYIFIYDKDGYVLITITKEEMLQGVPKVGDSMELNEHCVIEHVKNSIILLYDGIQVEIPKKAYRNLFKGAMMH